MSGRFLNLALAFGLLLAIGLASVSTGSYAQSEPKNLHVGGYVQLIRPDANTNRPLFRFYITVNDEAGNPVEIPSQGVLQKQLQIFQTNPPRQASYEPFYVSAPTEAGESVMPRYALVVFDISGSMNDGMGNKTKFEAAKNAAEKVLGYFEPNIDHVAIVPFESHNVNAQIREASFVTDSKLAIGQLKNLPLPKSGNTGLFSAVLAGLEVLGNQDSRAARILVVMTDGKNEVYKPKDDPDLIEGTDVPDQLVDQIRAKQLPVYIIGFGKSTNINEVAMRKLAAPNESNYIPAQDEKELERAFKKIRSGMVKNIQAVIKPDETNFDNLSGADRVFKVQINTISPPLTSLEPSPFVYSPPLSGSPTTSNSASKEELEALNKTNPLIVDPSDKHPLPPYVILLIYAALIAMLWFVLPRFIWPEYAAAGPKAAPAPAARRPMPNQQTGGYTAGGWRTQSGQTGRTMGGRLGGSPKTNVGPDRNSSGPKQ